MQSLADWDLIRCFELGDRKAFEELVSRYTGKVFRLSLSFLKKTEDAEEVVQDVFTRVYCKAKYFKGDSAFSSWIYRVTVNCCLMKIRKFKRRQRIDFVSIADQEYCRNNFDDFTAYKALEQKEVQKKLTDALSSLSPSNRRIVCLRDIDGFSSSEVGSSLGISVAAVKSKLHRARSHLRKELGNLRTNYNSERKVA